MLQIDQERCKECGLCIGICPVQAIRTNQRGRPQIHKEKCVRCGMCRDICPADAVRDDRQHTLGNRCEGVRVGKEQV